jgi:hypothetical protein
MNTTKSPEKPKTYSKMKLDFIRKRFDLRIIREPLFEQVPPLKPSAWLTETLQKGLDLFLISEKARSEFLVVPILLAMRDFYHCKISIYSGARFDIDAENGLQGVCDFIISKSPPLPTIQAPVMMMVEAKKNDIEEGLGQCAAEMIAARLFNKMEQNPIQTIFGCVTTGEDWQFLKLEEDVIQIDKTKLFINQLDLLLGTFKTMIEYEDDKAVVGAASSP